MSTGSPYYSWFVHREDKCSEYLAVVEPDLPNSASCS